MMQKSLSISTEDASILWDPLSIRKNVIETGDWRYSNASNEVQGRPVRALVRSQMEMLIQIDDLMKKLTEYM